MTKAGIQPFCRAISINIRYFDGIRVFPRTVTEINKDLYLYNNHFCVIWKSGGVGSNKALKQLERKFKKVDNFITEERLILFLRIHTKKIKFTSEIFFL